LTQIVEIETGMRMKWQRFSSDGHKRFRAGSKVFWSSAWARARANNICQLKWPEKQKLVATSGWRQSCKTFDI